MELLKEQIKHEEELLRLLWVTAIATIGGSEGTYMSGMEWIAFGIGAGLLFLLVVMAWGVTRHSRD